MHGWSYTIICKIVFISLFLSSCNYNNQKSDPQSNNGTDTNFLADTLITDELIMTKALLACQNCHAGAKQPTLDSAEAVRANITQVLAEIDAGDMPPPASGTPALNSCQKALVKSWADRLAQTVGEIPECKSSPGVGTNPDLPILPIELMPLNFETLRTKLLQPKCVLCHNPKAEDWESAMIPFTTYEEITTGEYSKYWKAPGIKSKVYEEISYHNNQEDNGMPPNDSGIKRVTKAEMDFVVRWIDAGNPEK